MKETNFTIGRYCQLTTDTGFKAVFCNEKNLELLKKLKEPELNTEHDIVSTCTLMDAEYKSLAPNIINIIIARLYESKTSWAECETDAERCCYILSHSSRLSGKPLGITDNDWASAIFDAAEVENLSATEKEKYLQDMMTARDWNSCLESRHDDGFAEGLAVGEARGVAMGKAEGLAEGKAEQSREIAVNLKNAGVGVDTIAVATGLSVEEVNML